MPEICNDVLQGRGLNGFLFSENGKLNYIKNFHFDVYSTNIESQCRLQYMLELPVVPLAYINSHQFIRVYILVLFLRFLWFDHTSVLFSFNVFFNDLKIIHSCFVID